VNCARSCASCCLSSDGPLGETFPSGSHAQSEGYISNHTDLSPHCVRPRPVATASRLPFEGCTMSTDQALESSLHPGYVQQPPDWIIDYCFNFLGLSLDTAPLETPSNLPTLPSSFPVLNNTGTAVSESCFSHTTPKL
jgi:hypothetical protein